MIQEPVFSKQERLLLIRRCVELVVAGMKDPDHEAVIEAFSEYSHLVNVFYEEWEEYIAPQQYKRAKIDAGYFFDLIDLVIGFCEQKEP